MKILFVRPNSNISGPPPPIGLGYLSHAVKSVRGDETLIVEARRLRLSDQMILDRVADFQPDVIGVTGMTCEARQALSVISAIKDRWPDLPVVLGGPHATTWGPSLLDRISADYLVIGEGEDTLVELLDLLEGKRSSGSVKGLVWRDEGKAVFNGPRPFIEDLDRLDVDWEAIGPENYFGGFGREGFAVISSSNRRLPIFTSRGCPYECTYCHNIFGRKHRTFDTEKTITRMIKLRDKYHIKEFEIVDDNFNVNMGRAKDFLARIIDRELGCKISFPNGLRADRMDEELIDLLVKANTYHVYYAIESASPRIQKMIRKNLDLDKAREVVNMTASRHIVTGTYNMLGFPTETEEEMAATVDFAVSLKNHVACFFYLSPFPGTEIVASDPELQKKVQKMDFALYSGLTINVSSVPDEVLIKMRRTAWRRFYFSPHRIARIARDVPKNLRFVGAAMYVMKLILSENARY